MKTAPSIAVLLPALDEENTIVDVISSFRTALPNASIFVYDNDSTDNTAKLARQAGGIVRTVLSPGKGNVMARMFAEIDADIYVLCDADDTYDASAAPELIRIINEENLDMVIGQRNYIHKRKERSLHIFGNRALTSLVASIFKTEIGDMLSGYRIMTRRYVRSFPCLSTGFSVETEMTIHMLSVRIGFREVPTDYKERHVDSQSKLGTFSDGFRIMAAIIKLTQSEKSFAFYTVLAILLGLVSIFLGIPVIMEYMQSGLVPRFPTAILAASMGILAYTSFVTGIIVTASATVRKENQRFQYLNSMTEKV